MSTAVSTCRVQLLAPSDRIHLDGSVSGLQRLCAQDRTGVPGCGGAVDLGTTVGEALATLRTDGGNDALGGDDRG